VLVARRPPGGTFASPVEVPGAATGVPDVAVGPDGGLLLAWTAPGGAVEHGELGPDGRFLGGRRWAQGGGHSPQVAVAPDGTAVLAWAAGERVEVRQRPPGGATFSVVNSTTPGSSAIGEGIELAVSAGGVHVGVGTSGFGAVLPGTQTVVKLPARALVLRYPLGQAVSPDVQAVGSAQPGQPSPGQPTRASVSSVALALRDDGRLQIAAALRSTSTDGTVTVATLLRAWAGSEAGSSGVEVAGARSADDPAFTRRGVALAVDATGRPLTAWVDETGPNAAAQASASRGAPEGSPGAGAPMLLEDDYGVIGPRLARVAGGIALLSGSRSQPLRAGLTADGADGPSDVVELAPAGATGLALAADATGSAVAIHRDALQQLRWRPFDATAPEVTAVMIPTLGTAGQTGRVPGDGLRPLEHAVDRLDVRRRLGGERGGRPARLRRGWPPHRDAHRHGPRRERREPHRRDRAVLQRPARGAAPHPQAAAPARPFRPRSCQACGSAGPRSRRRACGCAAARPRGSVLTGRLSRPASLRLDLVRLVRGRRAGRHCVARRRSGTSCVRTIKLGVLRTVAAGTAVRVVLDGRRRGRPLAAGRYQLSATPQGGRSASVRFTIRR
jgi:hypothetical protein